VEKSCVVFVIVKGVLGYENCIVMIQEKNKPEPKLWKLVGGTRENGESLSDTASREVLEEIGVTLRDVSDNDVVYQAEIKGKHSPYDFILFEGRYLMGQITKGEEVEEIGFFSPAQIKEMIKNRQIVKNHADALRACLPLNY